jgi:hypothetical protein
MIKTIKDFLYKLYLLFPYSFGRKKKYLLGNDKSNIRKFVDLFSWLLRDDQFNHHYYSFGLNLKKSRQKEFIGRKEFLAIKYKVEYQLKKDHGFNELSYDVVTKDKFIANAIFTTYDIPSVPVLGLVNCNEIFYTNGKIETLNGLLHFKNPFVLKNVILECGDGFMLCKSIGDKLCINDKIVSIDELRRRLGKGKWIIQNKIESHKRIRSVNSSALNTTRVVTILNRNDPVYLTGFQSFATGNTQIDSWDRGSVYVGINYQNSILVGWGYYHPSISGFARVEEHPDTGIKFDGYSVPFLRESVQICLEGHRLLYNNFVIGWDVVITDNGPFILEANEKPGMNAVQCIDGGLRNIIKEYYRNTINHIDKY